MAGLSGPFDPYDLLAGPLLHVSEPIDPTLWAWLSDKIDHVLGLSPGVVIAIIGTFIVVFPIVLMFFALRNRPSRKSTE